MKRVLIISGIFFIIAAVLFMALRKKEKPLPVADPLPKKYVAAEGKIEAKTGFEAEVGSELDGKIAEFFVKEGDTVKKGDIIARLENSDIRAKLKETEAQHEVSKAKLNEVLSGARAEEIRQAKAALDAATANKETAQKEFSRYQELFREALVPKSALDEKERLLRVAEARMKEAAEALNILEKGPRDETVKIYQDEVVRAGAAAAYLKALFEKTFIRAPLSGKIIRKNLDSGEIISKEMLTSLVTIADVSQIWVNAEIDETDIGRIQTGDKAEVTSDAYPGKVFHGTVKEISDYVGARRVTPVNPAKNLDVKVIQVKIGIEEAAPFVLGMTVDVRITPAE